MDLLAALFTAQFLATACGSAPPGVSSAAGEPSRSATTPGSVPSATALATSSPTPTPEPLPEAYDGVSITEVAAQIIDMHGVSVGYLAASADAVWAATPHGLTRIDPGTLEVKPVNGAELFGIAAIDDAVWTANFGFSTVTRVDATTGKSTVVVELLGNANTVSILGNSVWVAQHRGGTVTRLQEPSGKVVKEVRVGPKGPAGPHAVAAAVDGVWVGVTNIGSVVRIDPSTNAVVATIKTTASPCGGIAVQPSAVWVSSCYDDHVAIRIDPRTNTVVAEIDIGGPNGGAVLVDGYPWFPVRHRLVRIDPATNAIDRIVEFTKDPFGSYGTTLAFDSIWVGGENGLIARLPLSALSE
jgi:hypothetical protein